MPFEYLIMAIAAVAVFGAVALPILVWASMRRTEMLRRALNAAMTRIDVLESSITSGELEAFRHGPAISASASRRQVGEAIEVKALPDAAPHPEPEPTPVEPAIVTPIEATAAAPAETVGAEPQSTVPPSAAPLVAAPLSVAAAAAALAGIAPGALAPQIGVSLALAAGVSNFGVAEWLRRRGAVQPYAGAVLNGLGVLIVIGALRYAVDPLAILPALFAFGVSAATAAAALALSLRHGAALALVGVAAGAAAPALFDLGDNAVLLQSSLQVGLLTGALILARALNRPPLAWAGMAAALGWAGWLAWRGGDVSEIVAIGGFAAALALLGLTYASDAAHDPTPMPQIWGPPGHWREPLAAGHVLAIGACLTMIVLVWRSDQAVSAAAAAILTVIVACLIAALLRPGLALMPLAAAAAGAAALTLWPETPQTLVNAPTVIVAAGALAFIASLGGWLLALRSENTDAGAALAAFGPIAALVAARIRTGAFGPELWWIGAALTAAMLSGLAMARAPRAMAATLHLAGALLALAAAVWIAAPQPWTTPALCAAIVAFAGADARFDQRGFRAAAGALTAAVLARLAFPEPAALAPLRDIGWTAPSAPHVALAATMFAVAGSLFAFRRERAYALAPQGMMAAAIALVCIAIALWIRSALGQSQAAPVSIALTEIGLYAGALLVGAIAFSWRFGSRATPIPFWAETAMIVAAGVLTLIIGGVVRNPWWGLAPATVHGGPGVNGLLIAFGLPALGFLAYGWMRAKQGFMVRAELAAGAGVALLLMNLTLELRRLFHRADMHIAQSLPVEGWSITLAWVGFAGGMLALGFDAQDRRLRTLALAVALAAIVKSAAFDLDDFTGLARIAMLGLIAAAIGGLLAAFRRFAWKGDAPRPRMAIDPNLMPPQ
ncbi:MAG: DUF2339 domain-containing protein [Alphaproteobacteria bacterium]|nr:DUF2339 domain-containing protein [Alphaproteobacteria bacterium]